MGNSIRTIFFIINLIRSNVRKEYNVLVVEDEEMNYLYLVELFKLYKESIFTVFHAENGQKAVDIALDNDIHLVLMDTKLPIMDGYTATKLIKKQKPNLPVIFQSAYIDTSEKAKARLAGCSEYIAKPILKDEFFVILDKVINSCVEKYKG